MEVTSLRMDGGADLMGAREPPFYNFSFSL